MGAGHALMVELVEGHMLRAESRRIGGRQRQLRGAHLALQGAAVDLIELDPGLVEIFPQAYRLALAGGGEFVVVALAKARLAVADEVNGAHDASCSVFFSPLPPGERGWGRGQEPADPAIIWRWS